MTDATAIWPLRRDRFLMPLIIGPPRRGSRATRMLRSDPLLLMRRSSLLKMVFMRIGLKANGFMHLSRQVSVQELLPDFGRRGPIVSCLAAHRLAALLQHLLERQPAAGLVVMDLGSARVCCGCLRLHQTSVALLFLGE